MEYRREGMRRLVEFIHARENEYDGGCPLMMIYPFAKQERMSGTWLVQMLKKLTYERVLYQSYGHYRVIAFDYSNYRKLV